jgi:hypothetical protein
MNYTEMTIRQLKTIAADLQIKNYSRMVKAALIAAIESQTTETTETKETPTMITTNTAETNTESSVSASTHRNEFQETLNKIARYLGGATGRTAYMVYHGYRAAFEWVKDNQDEIKITAIVLAVSVMAIVLAALAILAEMAVRAWSTYWFIIEWLLSTENLCGSRPVSPLNMVIHFGESFLKACQKTFKQKWQTMITLPLIWVQ